MAIDPKTLRAGLTAAATLATIAVAVHVLDWRALAAAAGRIDAAAVAACCLACVATHLILAFRWARIAGSPEERTAGAEALIAMHASLFNLVTPTALGADLYRVANSPGSRARRTGLVLLERVLGVWAQAAIYLAALAATAVTGGFPDTAGGVFVAPGAALGAVALAIMLLPAIASRLFPDSSPRRAGLHGLLGDVAGALARNGRERSAWLACLSLAAVVAWVAAAAALAGGAGLTVPLPALAMITILAEFARLLPLTVQGIGVREAAFAWGAQAAGGQAEVGFVLGAVLYGVNYLVVIALGLASLGLAARSRRLAGAGAAR